MILDISLVHWLVMLSIPISVGGVVAYIRDTLSGRTKPNRVTWFIWAFAPLVSVLAALNIGADLWATVRVFLAGFFPLLIFLFSFKNPKSYWQLHKSDYLFGFFAFVGILLWIIIDSPRSAILFLVIADSFATLPTVIKAWKQPETETGITYIAALVSTLLILPSIPEWNIENSAFQIYLLVANIVLIGTVYRKRIFYFRE